MKIRNHFKSVFIVFITVVLMSVFRIINFDASVNIDFAFLLTCVLFLIALFSFGFTLFHKGKKETCVVTTLCTFSLIIFVHKLHHISVLIKALKNFNIFSPYIIALGITFVIAVLLLLIKWCLQSSESTKEPTVNIQTNNENLERLPKHNNNGNSVGYRVAVVGIDAILILAVVFGFYFIDKFHMTIWQEAFIVVIGIPILLYASLWFSKEIFNLLKYKNDRSEFLSKIKTHWLSLTITVVLEYFGYKKGFSSGWFKNFADNDLGSLIAFPLTLILILITTLLLSIVIHKILSTFTSINEENFPSNNTKDFIRDIKNKIFKIVKDLWDIVFNTINGIINFVKGIPSYFNEVSKIVIPEKKKEDLTVEHQYSNLMRLAAFGFTIISCITTSVGLGGFVFSKNNLWQAGLISFSIQTLLFVLNLKFPEFLYKVLNNVSINGGKVKIKRFVAGSLFVLSFVTVLLSSSLFSFVYIFDESYLSRNISYIDANIVLTKDYNEVLKATNDYINENIKATIIIASKQLGDLIEYSDTNSSETTLETLKNNLLEKENKLAQAEIAKNNAKKNYDDADEAYKNAQNDVRTLEGVAYVDRERYEQTKETRNDKETERENAKLDYDKASDAYIKADNAYKEAKNAVDSYKPSENEVTKEFLSELLKDKPSKKTLENDMKTLSSMISIPRSDKDTTISSNGFGDIVKKTKALNFTVEQFSVLTNKENELAKGNYSLEEIKLPDSAKEDSKWKEAWQKKYDSLKKFVLDIPSYAKANSDNLESTIISTDLLENYIPSEKIDTLNQSERLYLSDINKIEKSLKSLWKSYGNKYTFNARFSSILALFFDLVALMVGLFIYYYEKNDDSMHKNKS